MTPKQFVFKGGRDYLHSTTVFDYILGQIGSAPKAIDFRFGRRTDRICSLTQVKPAASDMIASYVDSERSLYVVETAQPITDRVTYDEEGLAENFKVDEAMIQVVRVQGYSFIECAVAAYKRLLIALHGRQRFAFVRLTLKYVPEGVFTVVFTRKLAGDFYQGAINEGGTNLGSIFFGKWQ